jgi:hypothetical protein
MSKRPKHVVLIYVGRRLNGEKLAHAFLQEGAEDTPDNYRFWSKMRWVIVGRRYVGLQDGERMTLSNEPKAIDDWEAPEEQRTAWRACEAADKELHRYRLDAARYDKDPPEFQAAVRALTPLVKNLSFTRRRALVEALVSRAMKRA